MAGLALRMQFEPVRTLAAASIIAGYMGVGTAIDHPARQFLVQNLTDVTLMFSFDGVVDHFALPANGFFLSDVTSNMAVSKGFYLAEGERLYVREIGVPLTGSVYFSVIYGNEV